MFANPQMLVLDTDHLSILERDTARGPALADRLARCGERTVTTIVTVEELLRGWLSQIARAKSVQRQVAPYRHLRRRIELMAEWELLDFDEPAAHVFMELRARAVRIGTMDLKIAAIVLANDATLLTRNIADFARVPQLKMQNWSPE